MSGSLIMQSDNLHKTEGMSGKDNYNYLALEDILRDTFWLENANSP